MKTLVINVTRLTQHIEVRHADQKLDVVQLVPQGRTHMREGMTIDPRWLQKNPGVVKTVPDGTQAHTTQEEDA